LGDTEFARKFCAMQGIDDIGAVSETNVSRA